MKWLKEEMMAPPTAGVKFSSIRLMVFAYPLGLAQHRKAKNYDEYVYCNHIKYYNMAKTSKAIALFEEKIINKIYLIRDKKVMLDFDLAEMYAVETKQLKRQVRRNIERFPVDFMFVLTAKEFQSLRSQSGTLKRGEHSKYSPMAFTEQGVAMLSGVLNSQTAIEVNIQIIRVFTKMRELLLTNKDILLKLEQVEKKMLKQDNKMKKYEDDIQMIFEALKQLFSPPQEPRRSIGFKRSNEEQ
jgi:phage regulator Rha-like protein